MQQLLDGIEVLQVAAPDAARVCRRAVDFAGQMALQLGAAVYCGANFETDDRFLGRGKVALNQPILDWLDGDPARYLLVAAGPDTAEQFALDRVVLLQMDTRASEATLFAQSGLADLLGDPDSAPIVPQGDFGSGTVAYGVLAALTALVCKQRRFAQTDRAQLDGVGVLGWVNWKAAAAGHMGKDIQREGKRAEWPVLPCADGYVALVYVERDWQPLVALIGDERLQDKRFASFKGRSQHRDEYLAYLREWTQKHTKVALGELFAEHHIPSAAVMTSADLLEDALLKYRNAFVERQRESGQVCLSPVLPHRIVTAALNETAQTPPAADPALPLQGLRVLDLGIITAGAGVSALLADLGAEVLKIESHTYPDPFRQWAGADVSPLFKCNNRNKYGVAIDLKTEAGKARFLDLVRTADVVLENFRRGVLDRLGLTYEVLQQANPNIMLATISGQGLDGPGSHGTSFGSTLEASSGFAAKSCYDDGVPFITGRNVNYPDQTVVLYAAAVITAALSRPRRGMKIDVSQRDVAVFLSGEELEQLSAGEQLTAAVNGHAYRCADDRWVAFDDSGPLPVSAAAMSDWVAERSAPDVIAALNELGVGAAVASRGSEMYAALSAAGSTVFANSPNGDLVKGFPFQLGRTPMRINLDSPEVGEHTAQFVQTSATTSDRSA